MARKIVLSVRLDETDAQAVDNVAKALDVSRSWIIRKLIKNGLEDLYLGEEAKRRLIEAEWVDLDEVESKNSSQSIPRA